MTFQREVIHSLFCQTTPLNARAHSKQRARALHVEINVNIILGVNLISMKKTLKMQFLQIHELCQIFGPP